MGGDGTEDGRGVGWEGMARRMAGEWGGRRWYGGWQGSGVGGDGTEDGRGVGWEEMVQRRAGDIDIDIDNIYSTYSN